MQASKVIMKTTYDIKINQILLLNIVGFTHLNFFEAILLDYKITEMWFWKTFLPYLVTICCKVSLSGLMLQVRKSFIESFFE